MTEASDPAAKVVDPTAKVVDAVLGHLEQAQKKPTEYLVGGVLALFGILGGWKLAFFLAMLPAQAALLVGLLGLFAGLLLFRLLRDPEIRKAASRLEFFQSQLVVEQGRPVPSPETIKLIEQKMRTVLEDMFRRNPELAKAVSAAPRTSADLREALARTEAEEARDAAERKAVLARQVNEHEKKKNLALAAEAQAAEELAALKKQGEELATLARNGYRIAVQSELRRKARQAQSAKHEHMLEVVREGPKTDADRALVAEHEREMQAEEEAAQALGQAEARR